MSKEFIVEVTKQEKEIMESIFEKISSLRSLSNTLVNNNKYADKTSEFYNRFMEEWNEAEKNYKVQWKKLSEKYNLDPDSLSNYELSFGDSSVYLIK